MKRRGFLNKLSVWFIAITGSLAGFSFLRQFYPPSFVRKKRVKLGDLHEFPLDTFTYIDQYELFVYRDHEGVQAVSAVCTHLGCILKKAMDGFELSGPAPSNLTWYNLYSAQDGKLMVDMGSRVDAGFKYRIS